MARIRPAGTKQEHPRPTPKADTAEESLFVTEIKIDQMTDNPGTTSTEAESEAYRAIALRREKGI